MIPEGWREVQLKDVIKLASGDGRPSDVVGNPDDQRTNPVYGGNGVLGFSEEANSHADDIIIGRVGEYCGITRFVPGPKWITDNALYVKTIEVGFDRRFLALKLQHYDLSRLRSKGGQPLVSQKPIYGLRFGFPPEDEQVAIRVALKAWDRAIETVEALIANARAQKQALMQQLLPQGNTPPKKRLPGFSGEWKRVALGEIGTISSAGVDKNIVEGEAEVRLLNFLDAYNREFIYDSDLNHRVTAPIAKVQGCNVRKGDVFFTPSSETRDDIALAAVAVEDMPGVVYSYHVVRFRPTKKLDLKFCAFLFQIDDFKRQAYRLGDGSGQRYVISQSNFRKMLVSLPSIDEQAAIGALLADHSTIIADYDAQLTALRQEKAALMQQLLTGKRRVKLPESEAAHA